MGSISPPTGGTYDCTEVRKDGDAFDGGIADPC